MAVCASSHTLEAKRVAVRGIFWVPAEGAGGGRRGRAVAVMSELCDPGRGGVFLSYFCTETLMSLPHPY